VLMPQAACAVVIVQLSSLWEVETAPPIAATLLLPQQPAVRQPSVAVARSMGWLVCMRVCVSLHSHTHKKDSAAK
jgi:hypothetical protein